MVNHHLNRKQRRYLQKSVGASIKNETMAQKFDRIRQNQIWGKQIHSANVESSYIENSAEYNSDYVRSEEHEAMANAAVQEMMDHSIPMSSESLLINSLGAND